MDSVGYTALSTLGIVVANQGASLIRERWKGRREDAKAQVIAQKVIGKIEENTAVNLDQINTSNNYNEKIAQNAAHTAALHGRLDRVEGSLAEIRKLIEALPSPVSPPEPSAPSR